MSNTTNFKIFCLILVACTLILTACEKDKCAVNCPGTTGAVIVNQDCECDCSTTERAMVSGPVLNHCVSSLGSTIFALRLEEYANLDCELIDILFIQVSTEFEPFTAFLPTPFHRDDIKEEAFIFNLNVANGGKFHALNDALSCFAVTQNGGDTSELVIYSRLGTIGVYDEKEAKPIYLPNCEDELLPARAKGYFDDELISLHFFFYATEEVYFNNPDQYLYSEVLNFERQYSKNELEE